MKKIITLFLQILIVLMGISVIGLMLWEPHIEGRNVNATLFQIYFNDPFLAYVYITSSAFFIGLYQAFKLLGYARHNKLFSQEAVKCLRTIKYCAGAMIGFVAGAEVFILLSSSDDRAGGVFMGILIAVGSIVVVFTAAKFEQILQNAVDIKSKE